MGKENHASTEKVKSDDFGCWILLKITRDTIEKSTCRRTYIADSQLSKANSDALILDEAN